MTDDTVVALCFMIICVAMSVIIYTAGDRSLRGRRRRR